MKKIINDVGLVEDQMIQGLVKAYPELRKLDCGNVVVRAQKKGGRVAPATAASSMPSPT